MVRRKNRAGCGMENLMTRVSTTLPRVGVLISSPPPVGSRGPFEIEGAALDCSSRLNENVPLRSLLHGVQVAGAFADSFGGTRRARARIA
jgi:hypothetical protein